MPTEQPDFFNEPKPVANSSDATSALPLQEASQRFRPLAARMRPRSLAEVAGQEHIVGEGCLLPRLVRADSFGSILLYGPPGCGKTSLAEVIAAETSSRFVRLNAVLSNVAELRDILSWARKRPEDRLLLFIDEIHRFNKAQQDLLLPDVEAGNLRLIGATTHNPGHYVNPPLLSRSHLFRLEPLPMEAVVSVLSTALTDMERGLGASRVSVDDEVLEGVARISDGDLRRALNALETLVMSVSTGSRVTTDDLKAFALERQIRYDADEDEHYDTISAFIKSVRGSDPDAALYWLAKMVVGGEDPRFIARRLVILASEDIGLADSRGLSVAVAAQQAVEFIGMPEAEYPLAHATLFLALAPKSNSAGVAFAKAKQALKGESVQPVPLWLRDSSTKAAKQMGYGDGYKYSHDYAEGISGQDYMVQPREFYVPGKAGAEEQLAARLLHWKNLKARLKSAQRQGSDTQGT